MVPEVFEIKNVPINMGSILNCYGATIRAFINSHKLTPVNHVYCMRPSTRLFLPTKAGDVKKFQAYLLRLKAILVTRLWPGADSVARNAWSSQPKVEVAMRVGFSKICFKHRSV
jgi:hypothetical protein